jgi:hypothetical protein
VNVVLLTSHAIAEHDDVEMFTRMPGVDVYSIGGAYDEAHPFEDKRPAVPGIVRHPDLEAATDAQRVHLEETLGAPFGVIDWAKAHLAPAVVEWADAVIVHHFPEQWIGGNWAALRAAGRRVIWRTCGQSDIRLELAMRRFREQGLEIVRYSPRERDYFGQALAFAGEDALIRFGKDPAAWTGWTGEIAQVGNVTQHMAQRGVACGYNYWREATAGLPVWPAGPGSDVIPGGTGALDYEAMRRYLRQSRVYLYTGTRPASYTLGLIEAMLTGTPVVSIGPGAFDPPGLLEPLALFHHDDPAKARRVLASLLSDHSEAEAVSRAQQALARSLFSLDTVSAQWAAYLGVAA